MPATARRSAQAGRAPGRPAHAGRGRRADGRDPRPAPRGRRRRPAVSGPRTASKPAGSGEAPGRIAASRWATAGRRWWAPARLATRTSHSTWPRPTICGSTRAAYPARTSSCAPRRARRRTDRRARGAARRLALGCPRGRRRRGRRRARGVTSARSRARPPGLVRTRTNARCA